MIFFKFFDCFLEIFKIIFLKKCPMVSSNILLPLSKYSMKYFKFSEKIFLNFQRRADLKSTQFEFLPNSFLRFTKGFFKLSIIFPVSVELN